MALVGRAAFDFFSPRSSAIEVGARTVSSRKRKVTSHATAEKVAGTAQGRKYGYFLWKSLLPNRRGNLSAGRANDPPMMGPIWQAKKGCQSGLFGASCGNNYRLTVDPVDHAMGM